MYHCLRTCNVHTIGVPTSGSKPQRSIKIYKMASLRSPGTHAVKPILVMPFGAFFCLGQIPTYSRGCGQDKDSGWANVEGFSCFNPDLDGDWQWGIDGIWSLS